jgi:hypothetical protein
VVVECPVSDVLSRNSDPGEPWISKSLRTGMDSKRDIFWSARHVAFVLKHAIQYPLIFL